MSGNHGSVVGCIYLLQFNLGNVCRKSVKEATALCRISLIKIVIYVTSVELKTIHCFTNGNMARDAVERCM
jgi:hypothetical protein